MFAKSHKYSLKKRKLMLESQLQRCRNESLTTVVERNIETMERHRKEAEEGRTTQDRIADWITHFSGSMIFVYFHVLWFGVWILLNVGFDGLKPFDPFPYGLLTTIVSLEAIFLSTFVLVSQNRQAAIAEQRTELDLQINLLSEYELTRVLMLVDALAEKLDVEICDREELKELEQDVEAASVLHQIERNNHDPKKARS
jgi:uncharacterized membrane protein